VEGYRRAKTQVPDLQRISPKAALWSQDYLGDVELEPQERTEPLFPLITYLSGRDSYLSTVNTLSAPLGVVAASNSLRWSLLTLTHELSHSIVRGIVSLLYPDSKSDTELEEADRLLNSSGPAADLLSEIKRYLLIAIKKMQEAELTGPRTKLDLDILLQNWKTNVEEIFAHISSTFIEAITLSTFPAFGYPGVWYRISSRVYRSTLSEHCARSKPGYCTSLTQKRQLASEY
jgi:hypothetical protein